MSRRFLDALAAAACISLTTVACATFSVGSHVDRRIDFGRYRTFAWGTPDALPIGDPRLDGNLVFRDRLMGAIEKDFARRGFEHVAGEQADLLVHFHGSVGTRVDVNRIARDDPHEADLPSGAQVTEYDQATLVVDIVDARTSRLVWRGWAQDHLEKFVGNGDQVGRDVSEAVLRMLRQLPRGL